MGGRRGVNPVPLLADQLYSTILAQPQSQVHTLTQIEAGGGINFVFWGTEVAGPVESIKDVEEVEVLRLLRVRSC